MKTKLASLMVVFLLMNFHCVAQEQITVKAQNDDISNNLDLRAVASVFGESKDLQEFEMKLNDYDSQISNLDLNNDGEVDYLRVIESSENNVHMVVIQAVLGPDLYQDVATILVDRNQNDRTIVQVIGDSYLYGDNYIVEPVYIYTPSIFSYFWGNSYRSWFSPFYWGYYPDYYHMRQPYAVNYYQRNIFSHINHDYRYFYTDRLRNGYNDRLYKSISRNDYSTRYPDQSFSRRNQNVTNKHDFESSRGNGSGNMQTRPRYQNYESGRGVQGNYNNSGSNRQMNQNRQNYDSRTYSPSSNSQNVRGNNTNQTPATNRFEPNSNNRNNQTARPNSTEVRSTPVRVTHDNNSRPATVARPQPVRVIQQQPAASRQSEQPKSEGNSRSQKNDNERR